MSAIPAGWEVVIGLETHTQLSTASKIFSGSKSSYGAAPNTQANAVDLALPGTLPVMNKQAVEYAIMFGFAVNDGRDDNIARRSVFARKNYFYPDLPKGYQISQFELPVVTGGHIDIQVGEKTKRIQLTRAHLEEDAGKSLHDGLETHGASGIDLNRAGTPLLEIVSEPDMRSAAEAVAYAKALHGIVTWIGICDGNMQEGSFRCDANVSVRKNGDEKLGTRAEIKNVNSFRFLERAINYEVRRQIELIEDGGRVVQETRLYDADRDETRSMRSKEDSMDYRYFPDPDLLPLVISQKEIDAIRAAMPELPEAMRQRFMAGEYGLDTYNAALITATKSLAQFFEEALSLLKEDGASWKASDEATAKLNLEKLQSNARLVANWLLGEFSAKLGREGIEISQCPITPAALAKLLVRLKDGTLSGKIAKEIFNYMWAGEGDVDSIIQKRGLAQISDASAIEKIIDEVLSANQKSVDEFKAGKEKAFQALVGQVMKASKGKANPAQVNEILKAKLG